MIMNLKGKIIDNSLIENIEELKQKVEDLEQRLISKDNDINNLRESLLTNIRHYNSLIEKASVNESIEIKKTNGSFGVSLLLSGDQAFKDSIYRFNHDIELPNSIDFMPHLNGRVTFMQPKFKQAKNRFTNLVIGIPTIKRDKTSYLLETIKSLFDSMNEQEKENVLVVILIAEVKIEVDVN